MMAPTNAESIAQRLASPLLGKGRVLGLTLGLGLLSLLLARTAEPGTDAADQFLAGLVAWTLPLSLLALLWHSDKNSLSPRAVWLVRAGRDRRRLWIIEHAAPFVIWLGALLITCGIGLLVSRTRFDPLLSRDLLRTLPEVFLGGSACYATLLAFRIWLGRYACLALTLLLWTVGHLGAASIASPVGHLRFLLGLGPDLGVRPLYSEAALGVVAVIGLLSAPLRVPR